MTTGASSIAMPIRSRRAASLRQSCGRNARLHPSGEQPPRSPCPTEAGPRTATPGERTAAMDEMRASRLAPSSLLLWTTSEFQSAARASFRSHGNQESARRCCPSTRPGVRRAARGSASVRGFKPTMLVDPGAARATGVLSEIAPAAAGGAGGGRSWASRFDPDPRVGSVAAGAGGLGGPSERRPADAGVGHKPAGRLPPRTRQSSAIRLLRNSTPRSIAIQSSGAADQLHKEWRRARPWQR